MAFVFNNFSECIGPYDLLPDEGNKKFLNQLDAIDFGNITAGDWKYRWAKVHILCDIFSKQNKDRWASMITVIPYLMLGTHKVGEIYSKFNPENPSKEYMNTLGLIRDSYSAWKTLGVEASDLNITEEMRRNIPKIEGLRELFEYVADTRYQYIDTDKKLTYEFEDGVHSVMDSIDKEDDTGT